MKIELVDEIKKFRPFKIVIETEEDKAFIARVRNHLLSYDNMLQQYRNESTRALCNTHEDSIKLRMLLEPWL